jgi:hypothetical protein
MGRRDRNTTPREGSNRAAKLAAQRARAAADIASPRPFRGVAAECDLVALRNFVPSATAELTVAGATHPVRLATVLPGAVAALVRTEPADAGATDAVGYAALQTGLRPADPGAALAGALTFAGTANPGETLAKPRPGTLADVIDPAAALQITVHSSYDWWLLGAADEQVRQLVEHANSLIMPAARLDLGPDAVGAPWWADTGARAHVRWVHPADEDALMSALARVHAAGDLTLGDGSKFAGSFRSDGLLIPVFDVDRESHPDEWVPAAVRLAGALDEALADDSELTPAQRRSRNGIRARQVSL